MFFAPTLCLLNTGVHYPAAAQGFRAEPYPAAAQGPPRTHYTVRFKRTHDPARI